MTEATADLCDAFGDQIGVCALAWRDFGGHVAFAGPVRTIRCHEDNALIRATLSEPGHGGVLVVDGGGALRTALVGDNLGGLAVRNGWMGLVINGAVRDTAQLSHLHLGVKALCAVPRRSARDGTGEVDVAISIGGARIEPGMQLVADADGVVVLPAGTIEAD